MSQLIHMRQRIKAIQTIKKITSAMRLISRSLHTQLTKRRETLNVYNTTLCGLLNTIQQAQTSWAPERFFPTNTTPEKKLFIIIGSQKSMCGTYNNALFYWITKHHLELQHTNIHIISVGKKITDFIKRHSLTPYKTIHDIRPTDIKKSTDRLLHSILSAEPCYTSVTLISNISKNFFNHELKITPLIPFKSSITTNQETLADDYLWIHKPEQILDVLINDYLRITLEITLFESLVGEQAARFIAMDNATRNAKNFLSHMTLQYNKLRQAKITKELSELAGAFESQSFI